MDRPFVIKPTPTPASREDDAGPMPSWTERMPAGPVSIPRPADRSSQGTEVVPSTLDRPTRTPTFEDQYPDPLRAPPKPTPKPYR